MISKKLGTQTHTFYYEIDGMVDKIEYDLKNTAYDVTLYHDYDKSNRITSRVITDVDYVYNPNSDKEEDYTANGLCYTAGTVFYVLKSVPYANAVWHVFVIAGSACIFVAIYGFVI